MQSLAFEPSRMVVHMCVSVMLYLQIYFIRMLSSIAKSPPIHLCCLILTDIILVGVVECVDDGRLGGPLVLVDGLPQLGDVPLGLEVEDAEQVLQEGVVLGPQLQATPLSLRGHQASVTSSKEVAISFEIKLS